MTWFKNTRLLKHEDDNLIVGVPNIFIKQQLEKKYGDLITKTLGKNGVMVSHIEYKVSAQPEKVGETQIIETSEQAKVRARPAEDIRSAPAAAGSGLGHSYRQGLNERYTFDNFVVGASNELAFAACQAIAQKPGAKYNPLFLYGGVGIGKTHLIQAVGNVLARKNPDSKVLYISTEQFVQEFVDALRFRKTAAFARHYRTADVLIVDDIQFIAGKEKIQEEFFHTFNALHQANKQIILSADKPPKEIPTLEDRLRSRFEGGMEIDMQVPDFETRCAIVQAKAGYHDSELETEVVEYLATNLHTNIRELEG
ncbi:MAG: chromosomal replication initiator protein DnaA, partial [Candidatus Saccharimonadales bacterium]